MPPPQTKLKKKKKKYYSSIALKETILFMAVFMGVQDQINKRCKSKKINVKLISKTNKLRSGC